MGAPALPEDDRFRGNARRVRNAQVLDDIITGWTRTKSCAELEAALTAAGIPSTRAFTAADIATDPQFRFRDMVRDVTDPNFGSLLHNGIVPHFPDDPGDIAWPGPEIGEHTDEVLREVAGMSNEQIATLRSEGVVR